MIHKTQKEITFLKHKLITRLYFIENCTKTIKDWIEKAVITRKTCIKIYMESIICVINETRPFNFPPELAAITIDFLPVYSITKVFIQPPTRGALQI